MLCFSFETPYKSKLSSVNMFDYNHIVNVEMGFNSSRRLDVARLSFTQLT